MDISNLSGILQKVQKYFKLDDTDESDILQDEKSVKRTTGDVPEISGSPDMSMPQFVDYDSPLVADTAMVNKIFDKVVAITNEALPQYLAGAVNKEKQKKYLYDALDEGVKEYLAGLEAESEKKCMALWQKERGELKQEMDNLRERTRELEKKRTEMNEQNLSAERQKRALNDRVRDMETKIMELEAEKEQLDIENKSLLNKAKVATVYETDIEAMRKEIQELSAKAPSEQLIAENERLRAEVERLDAENQNLTEMCQAAKVKDEMGGEMIKDWQKRAHEAQKLAKNAEENIADLRTELQTRENKIVELEERLRQSEERANENQETVNGIQEITEQMMKFGELKQKLEDRIAQLRTELEGVRSENEELKTTIKNNLYSQAKSEKELKDQISHLNRQTSADDSEDKSAKDSDLTIQATDVDTIRFGNNTEDGEGLEFILDR